MDFTGTPIYDVYEDELCTTLGCNFCREPRHKADMKSQGGDNSYRDNVLSPVVIHEIHDMNINSFLDGSELGIYYKNLADGVSDGEEFLDHHYYRDPLFYEEETQGYLLKVINGARTSETQRHINYGLREKDCLQNLPRKPPDRDQNKEHSYVGPFETQEIRSIGSTDTRLLEETGSVQKLDHDHHDCLRKLSLMEKHALEYKFTYLREALALDKEKKRNLVYKVDETHKRNFVLNKGSASLDMIFSMGRTEKSTIGLGYQGGPSGTQTVFVRGKSVEQNKTKVDLDDEFCCDSMSGPLEWLVSKKSPRTENGLHGVINTSPPTGMKDINLATAKHLGVRSMESHLRLCERPWKYCRETFYDSLIDIYVAFVGTHDPLSPREETIDPVVPNKEIISLSSPICLDKLVLFKTVPKLSGEVSFLDVMFVICPTSYTWLVYFSKGSLQNLVILGVDVSYCRPQHVGALMRLNDLFVGKGKEKIQIGWIARMGSVEFYVGDLMTFGEDEHVLVQIIIKFICVRFGSQWKHVDLNRRPEAFDMIQFVWMLGVYKTVTFLELLRSTSLWTLCIHVNVVSFCGILRSSALWPLSHVDVTALEVLPSQWLQMELQWGVTKRKVEVRHNPQTGLGCIFMAIICWSNFACDSSNLWEYSNSAFQAAVCFLTLSMLPLASTKFSMVVWAITGSLGRELICGVIFNIFNSQQRQSPNKNARKILFNDVTRCTFLVGWNLIHSVVSYESLELRGEKNCSCAYVRHMSARDYFWIIVIADKVFHRGYAIKNRELQLVQDKKGVWMTFHCGSRTIFVIIEGKLFSLVRPTWTVLALRSAYLTFHLLRSISSLHELCHGIVTKEFDLVCLEFTAAGSAHMDVVESNFTRDSMQVLEFVGSFSHVQLLDRLRVSYAQYKAAAGWHRRYMGAYVWAIFTKECLLSTPYNHLKAGKVDPLEERGKLYTFASECYFCVGMILFIILKSSVFCAFFFTCPMIMLKIRGRIFFYPG